MFKGLYTVIGISSLLLLSGCNSVSQIESFEINKANLNEGIKAYSDGRHILAFRHFEPLAKSGDSQAQYYLGKLYFYEYIKPEVNYSLSEHKSGDLQSYLNAKENLQRRIRLDSEEIAAFWFEKSAKQGHKGAIEMLK